MGRKIAKAQFPLCCWIEITFAILHCFLFNNTSAPFTLIYDRLKTTITVIYCGLILHVFILRSVNQLTGAPTAHARNNSRGKTTTDMVTYLGTFKYTKVRYWRQAFLYIGMRLFGTGSFLKSPWFSAKGTAHKCVHSCILKNLDIQSILFSVCSKDNELIFLYYEFRKIGDENACLCMEREKLLR